MRHTRCQHVWERNRLLYERMVIFGGCVQTQVAIGYVPKVVDEIVEVVRLIPQERVQQRTVEQIVHVPVPQVVEEMTEVVQIIP